MMNARTNFSVSFLRHDVPVFFFVFVFFAVLHEWKKVVLKTLKRKGRSVTQFKNQVAVDNQLLDLERR